MDTLIQRILERAGPMPDAAAHTRYLRTLSEAQLTDRLKALEGNRGPVGRTMTFWTGRKNAPQFETAHATT